MNKLIQGRVFTYFCIYILMIIRWVVTIRESVIISVYSRGSQLPFRVASQLVKFINYPLNIPIDCVCYLFGLGIGASGPLCDIHP